MAAQPEPLLCARMAAQPEHQTLSIRSVITHELQQVAVEHGRKLAPLTDEIKLLESGLDSLGLAVLVIRLADSLGIDPFACETSTASPVTFGEFVRMYESLHD
jgi:acyl carrier protein